MWCRDYFKKGLLVAFGILFPLIVNPSYSKLVRKVNYLIVEILEKRNEDSIATLVVTGDVMLGRAVNLQIDKYKDPYFPFRKVKSLLESSDIAYINLENPIVDPCPSSTTGMIFCAPTSSIKALTYAGIDVVNLANNHTRNYGQVGYNSTIEYLEKESILYNDSDNIAEMKVGNTTFVFLGFDLVSRDWKKSEVAVRVANAESNVDVLVVGFHWGREYSSKPTEEQREVARLVIDLGADLVIGHHPHVIQPIEVYNGVPIAYSLGNFVFDQMWSERTKEGVVGKYRFKDGKLFDYEFIPIYINNLGQPEVVKDSQKADKIMSLLEFKE
jgi:poly-gamma-glutamate synthesis protein (capsule biosynthesis protein)